MHCFTWLGEFAFFCFVIISVFVEKLKTFQIRLVEIYSLYFILSTNTMADNGISKNYEEFH